MLAQFAYLKEHRGQQLTRPLLHCAFCKASLPSRCCSCLDWCPVGQLIIYASQQLSQPEGNLGCDKLSGMLPSNQQNDFFASLPRWKVCDGNDRQAGVCLWIWQILIPAPFRRLEDACTTLKPQSYVLRCIAHCLNPTLRIDMKLGQVMIGQAKCQF